MLMEGEEGATAAGAGRGHGDGGGAEDSVGHRTHRIIRCVKNRFGSTSELALLEMTDAGLVESQPARLFLSRSPPSEGAAADGHPAGSAVAVVLEGSRSLCAEVQVG